jgi:hypothetical protein
LICTVTNQQHSHPHSGAELHQSNQGKAMPHADSAASVHYRVSRDQRSSDRWHMDWPQEGFLRLDDDPDQEIQVTLVDFSCGGLAIVLSASHGLRPGQKGQLITQSHGSGCCQRPVHCTWQRPHPIDRDLQSAGFSFEAEPEQPPMVTPDDHPDANLPQNSSKSS